MCPLTIQMEKQSHLHLHNGIGSYLVSTSHVDGHDSAILVRISILSSSVSSLYKRKNTLYRINWIQWNIWEIQIFFLFSFHGIRVVAVTDFSTNTTITPSIQSNESIVLLNLPVATKLNHPNFLVWQSQIFP
jgi:uncharacterized protein with PQ loop repeat